MLQFAPPAAELPTTLGNEPIELVGHVSHSVENTLVVQATFKLQQVKALDIDTILCDKDKTVLGTVSVLFMQGKTSYGHRDNSRGQILQIYYTAVLRCCIACHNVCLGL